MAPYFLRNLIPRREKSERQRPLLTVLRSITWLQWAHFASGLVQSTLEPVFLLLIVFYRWLAWTCDAIDFFSVSLSVTNLQSAFGRSVHDIVGYIVFLATHEFDIFLDDIYHIDSAFPGCWCCE